MKSLRLSYESASGQSGAIGLPRVFCIGCGRPLHRNLLRRVSAAAAMGKMDQETIRCLRPDCQALGKVNLDSVLSLAQIIAAQDPLRRYTMAPGRGRPMITKKCSECSASGNSRWWWLHTGGGKKCKSTGGMIVNGDELAPRQN